MHKIKNQLNHLIINIKSEFIFNKVFSFINHV